MPEQPTAQFRAARERCLGINADLGPRAANCPAHFTGTYDRRHAGVEDRRTKPSISTSLKMFRVSEKPYGRREGDIARALVRGDFVPSRLRPTTPDRRASGDGRRKGGGSRRSLLSGPRRTGPTDRRVLNTWDAPARREIARGRRSSDMSYNRLPRATPPPKVTKPTLREQVAGLDGLGASTSPWIKREQVLALLQEYGVEDA